MSTELEVYEAEAQIPATLIPSTSPKEFMEHAGKVAAALVDLVNKEHMYTVVGKGKHLHVDAWTSLGSLLGSVGGKSVYAVPDGDPEPVEIDGVKGVRAKMKAVTIDGHVVGGATGFCMRDEPTWKNRPFYALAGMAETRATSRALRKPLGFIVRLAGYAATGAEEMPRGNEERIEDAEVITDPDGNVFPDQRPVDSQFSAPAGATDERDPNLASDAQLKNIGRLMSKLEKADDNVTRESLKAEVQLAYGVTSSKELTKKEASEVINGLKLRAGEDT